MRARVLVVLPEYSLAMLRAVCIAAVKVMDPSIKPFAIEALVSNVSPRRIGSVSRDIFNL